MVNNSLVASVSIGRIDCYHIDFPGSACTPTAPPYPTAPHLPHTPPFQPPPQFGDGPCSARAGDVWALGCTLFHMLVGRIPFGHRNPTSMADVLDAILDDPLDVPEDAGLSEECRDLLRCMLEKEPTKRITLVSRLLLRGGELTVVGVALGLGT